MSLALKSMTLEEFAPYAEDIAYELVDGELSVREMSNKTVTVGALIFDLLLQFSLKSKAGKAHSDGIAYCCFPDDPNRVRKPDVSWFNGERWKQDYLETTYIEAAPDLIVEVVSPNDSAYQVSKKVDEFFRAGTTEAWIVHPHIEQVERRFADGAARWYGTDENLDGTPLIPGFTWKLAEVLAKA